MRLAALVVFFWAFCFYAMAECNWYVEAGISFNDGRGKPEFNGSNPMGNYGVGYLCQMDDGMQIDLYPYKHDSSIPDWEQGYGYNRAGVTFRFLIK